MRGYSPEDDELECICPICGDRSRVDCIDEGYGETEFWGGRSVHSILVKISFCCKEELTEDDLI